MNKILTNIVKVKNLWGGVVPLHFLGIWAVYNLYAGTAPSWWYIPFFIGYFLINVLGVSIGYHRYFSHKGFDISRPTKIFLLICGVMSIQGSAIFWAGIHRGGHHKNSDTDLDPHNPAHGFWHSFILWQFRLDDKDVKVKAIIDLIKDEDVMFVHKHYNTILWILHIFVALVSLDLWLYFLVLPALISLYAYGLQTSTTHLSFMGYRNSETKDKSVNVFLNFPFVFGECWHNNHHANPGRWWQGETWWEIDPPAFMIKHFFMEKPNE